MGLIDLRYGTNPLPLDREVIAKVAAEAAQGLNGYPDTSGTRLKRAIARRLGKGFRPGNILVGNGLDSVINTISAALLGAKGERGAVVSPSFYIFSSAMRAIGAEVMEFPLSREFSLDVRAFAERMRKEGIALCFIANPNNPTGNVLVKDGRELARLAGACGTLVLDECYYGFCRKTFLREALRLRNLIVLRSLSKSYGLAGLRLGYAISREENIARVEAVASACRPFDAGTLSQAIGTWALGRKDRLAEFARLKREFLRRLEKVCDVEDTKTSFLLLRVKNAEETGRMLAKEGILVNTLAPYEMGGRYVRIGVPRREQIGRVVSAVAKATNNNKG